MDANANKIYLVEISDSVDTKTLEELSFLVCSEHSIHNEPVNYDLNYKMCIYSKLLTRVVIQQDLHIRNSNIKIDVSQYGKPFLKNNNEFHFNISHSQNMLGIAFSNKSIGVDIEKIREIDFRIAERFFADEEIKYLNMDRENRLSRFFEIWTKKEAYLKYLGIGLNMSLKSVNVFDSDISSHFCSLKYNEYIITMYFENYSLPPYVILLSEKAIVDLSKDLQDG